MEPSQAGNSLHQTLYFLRREIAPNAREGSGSEYVVIESELVYLDSDMVHVASASFARQARDLLRRSEGTRAREASGLIMSYPGRFAMEFEYEEWAEAWRDLVHGSFLKLAEATSLDHMRAQHFSEGAAVLGHALSIDPNAVDLIGVMAVAHYLDSARAAADSAYSRFAADYRQAYDAEPPPLLELVSDVKKRLRGP
jgi:DNA-binding SARP family transcriptional activator